MLTLSLPAIDRSLGTSSPFTKMPSYSPLKSSNEKEQQKLNKKNEKNIITIDPLATFIRILSDSHSVLGEKIPKVIFDISDTAPSPSRDYCQLVVVKPTHKGHSKLDNTPLEPQVTYRCWKITSRNHGQTKPIEVVQTISDYLSDEKTQNEVGRVFGEETREYVARLCQGQLCFLQYLPSELQVRVLAQLDLLDLRRLALVSRHFHRLCNSDELWRYMFETQRKAPRSQTEVEDLSDVAIEQAPCGWRKLFFMAPLQLQTSLARIAKRKRGGQLTNRSGQLTNRSGQTEIPKLALAEDANDESRRSRVNSGTFVPEPNFEVESSGIEDSAVGVNATSFFVTRPSTLHPQIDGPQIPDVSPELIDGLPPNPPDRRLSDDIQPQPAHPAAHSPARDNDPETVKKMESVRRWLDTQIAAAANQNQ